MFFSGRPYWQNLLFYSKTVLRNLIEKGSVKLKLPEMYIYIKETRQELKIAFVDSTDVEANIVNT